MRNPANRGQRNVRPTACEHVERLHYAHGLCEACDKQRRRRLDPQFYQRERAMQQRRLALVGKTEADLQRERRYRNVYGITPAEYEALAQQQDGLCAICGGEPNGRGRRLHVDHCHETGVVRGLLCGNCNTSLGLMADDPVRLLKAASYLTRGAQDGCNEGHRAGCEAG